MSYSFSRFLKVGNEVSSFLGFLETSKHHLGTRDVFLGVFKILEQSFRAPCNAFGFVGISVDVASCLSSFATKEAVQVGASLVLASSFNSVALSTPLNEELNTKRQNSVTSSIIQCFIILFGIYLLSLFNITSRNSNHFEFM